MTKRRTPSILVAVLSVALSACVTQDFENDKTPVVKNQANKDDMASTRISLGLGYLRMGNMAQAKQNLEKAKKFAPQMVQVHTAFAHYYETVGENELAITSFEEALSLKHNDADTLNNYGVYLCRQGQLEAAEKQLLKAIAVPSYLLVAKSYENLASCFLEKNDFVKGEMYLNKAVKHSPGNSSTLFQMVRLQYAMGEFVQAKVYEQRFEKATRRFTPQSLALAFKVYQKLGQRRTANNYGAMLVKMYPQSWEAQQYLLNELELIEADSLAKRYQDTQAGTTANDVKKRIVKLSPKKNFPTKNIENSSIEEPDEVNIITSNLAKNPNESIIKKETVIQASMSTVNAPTVSKNEQDKKAVTLEKAKVNKAAEKKIKSKKVINKAPEIHVVSKGDNLYGISVKYNIKIKALRRWNNFTVDRKIHINEKIRLTDPNTVNE